MKAILYIIGISILLQKGYGQTTTGYGQTTTGYEGSGTTVEPEPITSCEMSVVEVNNTEVGSDVDCETEGDVAADIVIVVSFESAVVGSVSLANVFCNANCSDGRPIGTRKCGADGMWSDVKWRNCTSQSNSPEQQFDDALTDTANTDNLTAEVVDEAVDAVEEFLNQGDIEQEDADTAVAIVNNILQASEDDVGDNEERILEAVDSIQETVTLTPISADYDQYTSEQSSLAIAVVGDSAARAFKDQNYYYGPTVDNDNLAVAKMEIKTGSATDDAMYILAKPETLGERISFQIYSNVQGILSTDKVEDVLSVNYIFAASGDALGAFTMNFNISEDVNGTELQAMVYNSTSSEWEDAGNDVCGPYSAMNSYGKVTCNEPGQYILRKVIDVTTAQPTTTPPVTEPDSTDLPPGVIAGIVIGSVVVVAIIVGIIIYCVKYKGKSNGVGIGES